MLTPMSEVSIAALITTVGTLLAALLGLVRQARGPRHEREMMALELDLLTKLPKTSEEYALLSEVVNRRAHALYNRSSPHWPTVVYFAVIAAAGMAFVGFSGVLGLVAASGAAEDLPDFLTVIGTSLAAFALLGLGITLLVNARFERRHPLPDWPPTALPPGAPQRPRT